MMTRDEMIAECNKQQAIIKEAEYSVGEAIRFRDKLRWEIARVTPPFRVGDYVDAPSGNRYLVAMIEPLEKGHDGYFVSGYSVHPDGISPVITRMGNNSIQFVKVKETGERTCHTCRSGFYAPDDVDKSHVYCGAAGTKCTNNSKWVPRQPRKEVWFCECGQPNQPHQYSCLLCSRTRPKGTPVHTV